VKKNCFQKLPRSLLLPRKPHQLFCLVAEDLCRQFEGPTDVDADRVERAPFSAQVVYWLWRFSCEAGICGMDVFLLNHVGIYAPQIHGSLGVIEANELVRRIEAAIPWALQSCAEFNRLKDRSWYEQFSPVREFPSLESVNNGTYDLVAAISPKAEIFIRANSDELFLPE
jgi:hypothetical protein